MLTHVPSAGCLQCKNRVRASSEVRFQSTDCRQRVKCDEVEPSCSQCNKRGLQCSGYRKVYKWSGKYEKFQRNVSQPKISAQEDANLCHARNFGVTTSTPIAIQPRDISLSAKPRGKFFGNAFEAGPAIPITDDRTFMISNIDGLEGSLAEPSPHYGFQRSNGFLQIADPEQSSSTDTLPGNVEDMDDILDSAFAFASPTDILDIPSVLENETDMLSRYYFTLVCTITSGFDSEVNPFRTKVADLISSEASIRQCVLSMSAAHLQRHKRGFRHWALEYRTDAITSLQTDLSRHSSHRLVRSERGSLISTLLIGTILLGMSSVS